ncbi:MAG TPA: hypothetical protein VMI13_02000, partial [Solirubrobacteraceae bacterium]|nr:hypothetical protein [Solirubrobacteraceae bacterium]
CFVRADRVPTRGRMGLFALTAALALLSHYFAVFLIAGMIVWLLRTPGERRRLALWAGAVLVLVGLALLPLVIAQGGHGTQWIGRWALSSRVQAIPQYYLTGYTGSALGHGVELLVALPVLAGLVIGVRALAAAPRAEVTREREGLAAMLVVAAAGILVPLALAVLGADYLAPRNLVGAMLPVSAVIAILVGSPRTGRAGAWVGALIVLASLAITIDVDASPRLQRGNWRSLAHAIGSASAARAVTTVQLGETPLQYYLPGLRNLRPGTSVLVDEIDETGYAPLRRDATRPPAPGFVLRSRQDHDGLILLRFTSPQPRFVSEAALRRRVITLAHPEVLVAGDARVSA